MIPSGQTAAIITVTASTLQLGISDKLYQFFSGLAAISGALVIALMYDWFLTLATGVGFAALIIIYGSTAPLVAKTFHQIMELDMQASSVATEALGSVKMITAFGAESKMLNRYGKFIDNGAQKGTYLACWIAIQQGLIYFAIYGTIALAFWSAFQEYLLMSISSPEPLMVVLLCVILMATSVIQVTAPVSAAYQAADASAIFHTIIDAAPISRNVPDHSSQETLTGILSADGDIVLENINFVYPSRPDVKVLTDLSLQFPAGKMTAIVGPSGSGKSTIVGILERWYEFDGHPDSNPIIYHLRSGSVSTFGQELRNFDVLWWRNQIGLVQQDSLLFTTSIYENVAYGLVGTKWEYADLETKNKMVKDACMESFADEFIDRLPEGYHTAVGELGIKLSGGQRQRLAIARAIVKKPTILILDEATSAIDVRSERIVQSALERVCKGRTTIVIAHRLETIKNADYIVVLRDGRVVQRGTHQSLLAESDGDYSRFAFAQVVNGGNENSELESPELIFSEKNDSHETKEASVLLPTKLPSSSQVALETDMPDEDAVPRVIGQPESMGNFGIFWTLFSEQKSLWKLYLFTLVAVLGAGVSTPLQAYLFAVLTSLFSLWGPDLSSLANFWCLTFACLAIGVGGSYALLSWSTTRLGFVISTKYKKEYLADILAKPASFFDEHVNAVGALVGRLAADPHQLQQLVGLNLAFMLMSLFNLVGSVIISLIFGWKLTLAALGTSLPVVMAAMFYRVRYEMRFESASSAVFAESARFACEGIAAIRTVSSLTLERQVCKRYDEMLQDHVNQAFRTAKISLFLFAVSDSVSLLCMAFVMWYGNVLLAAGEYTPFQYMLINIAVVQGAMSAGQWLGFGPNIASAAAAARRILETREDFNFLNEGNQVPEQSEKGAELELRDVWFEYPTRQVPVLKGLNLHVSNGQFAAIVGPSGSGKTTVISLLERFYPLEKGQILYNGIDVATIDLAHYRRNISLVAQEPNLFNGSIFDNITLGIDQIAAETDPRVNQAARDAGIGNFIDSLPEGYQTTVGSHGLALSGGQKQRVSLARALIRKPTLLLLDEATSSLDRETERRVQEALIATKGARTMVVVAHRLATVQNADMIFVMADGTVVEKGDHDSLLAAKGLYYQMVSPNSSFAIFCKARNSHHFGAVFVPGARAVTLPMNGWNCVNQLAYIASTSLEDTTTVLFYLDCNNLCSTSAVRLINKIMKINGDANRKQFLPKTKA